MNLTQLINIWIWPGFCIGPCALIIASGPDQSNELACLTVMMEAHISLILKILCGIDCTMRVLRTFGTWITHSCTSHKYCCYNHSHIKLKYYFIVITHQGNINTTWKNYTSHPVGATTSLCVLEYLQIKLAGVSGW